MNSTVRIDSPVSSWKSVLAGAALGLMMIGSGALLGGAGHGWMRAYMLGTIGMLTGPLSGLAWAKQCTSGKWLARPLLVGLWTDYSFFDPLPSEHNGRS